MNFAIATYLDRGKWKEKIANQKVVTEMGEGQLREWRFCIPYDFLNSNPQSDLW